MTDEILEKLIDQYVNQEKTLRELEKDFEISRSSIRDALLKAGVVLRPTGNNPNKEYHPKAWNRQDVPEEKIPELVKLFNEYTPISTIAKELGYGDSSIRRKINELKLSRDQSRMFARQQYDDSNDQLIISEYQSGKSSTEIAKDLGTTHNTILKHLKHCNINPRSFVEAQFMVTGRSVPEELLDKDKLSDLYIDQKLSKKEIGEMLGVDPSSVDTALKKFDIPVRGNSESKLGLYTGPDSPRWIDGRTSIYMRLREHFYLKQSKPILERDEYRCQCEDCDGSDHNLQIHHKRPFKEIFDEILSEHKDLNVIDDAEELYNIMTQDSRLNDLDNLITYCKSCHLFKIHKYTKRK